jgi:hypothetical protein
LVKNLDQDMSETVMEFTRYFKDGWTSKKEAKTALPPVSMPDAHMETETKTEAQPALPLESLPDGLEELKTELPLFPLRDESTETETLAMPERECSAV